MDQLDCGPYHIKLEPGLGLRNVTVQAPSWQEAWQIIGKNPVAESMLLASSVRLDLSGVGASAQNGSSGQPIAAGAVIRHQFGAGPSQPLLLNGVVKPQPMLSGLNRFYQRGRPGYSAYQLIEVDTVRGTVNLTVRADMPTR